jgi:hypothetical protein
MRRNQIAKLPQYAEFYLCRVAELKSHANHFFFCFSQISYGMAVTKYSEVFSLLEVFQYPNKQYRTFCHSL